MKDDIAPARCSGDTSLGTQAQAGIHPGTQSVQGWVLLLSLPGTYVLADTSIWYVEHIPQNLTPSIKTDMRDTTLEQKQAITLSLPWIENFLIK